MSRLKVAAQLIQDQEYKTALDMLKRDDTSKESFYWRSLICRLLDLYDDEKKIVDLCLQKYRDFGYMQERATWHKKPLFERMVPRQPLRMPRDPLLTPQPSVLEQMCFVTGGDSAYFPFIVECVESIRNTELYKDVDICILDCGLSDANKDYLIQQLNVKTIIDPGWKIDVPQETPESLKCIMCRPFFKELFPEYRYFFFIDADAWIHDERAIDRYLNLAITQGIGITINPGINRNLWKDTGWSQNNKLLPEDNQWLMDKRTTCAGVFCVDSDSGILEEWKKNLIKLSKQQPNFQAWGTDEATLVLTINQNPKVKTWLPHRDQFYFEREGFPVLHDKNEVWYTPVTNEVVGIVHLVSGLKKTGIYYLPTTCRPEPLMQQELQGHLQMFWNIFQQVSSGTLTQMPAYNKNPGTFSMRYRVWPWQDKASILSTLKNEIQEVLCRA